MHRDMILVREILDQVANSEVEVTTSRINDHDGKYNEVVISYHIKIMVEAGLLTCIPGGARAPAFYGARCIELTWAGNEVHDTLKDPDVWDKTKKGLLKLGGWSLATMMDVAKAYGKQVVAERLGLHFDG